MKKFGFAVLLSASVLSACDKADPILPGVRTSIFPLNEIQYTDKKITKISNTAYSAKPQDCPYTQDSKNAIYKGKTKIYTGFATSDFVKSNQKPVCDNGFVFAGLSTGELVKINPNTKQVEWSADIYSNTNMTGGSSILDITAPLVIKGNFIYVAGLGDAYCKISKSTGNKSWCVPISSGTQFILVDNIAFIMDTENILYAIDTSTGDAYWSSKIDDAGSIKYADGVIEIDDNEYDAKTGKIID